ncbi:MAG: hypothetical protein FWD53_13410, partial [Phycisphaerales bacterium]|nr:hypothetical protein [Phycisphaerales bacterium]
NFASNLAGQTITLSNPQTTPLGPTEFYVNDEATITIDGSNAPGLIIDGNNALRPFALTCSGLNCDRICCQIVAVWIWVSR